MYTRSPACEEKYQDKRVFLLTVPIEVVIIGCERNDPLNAHGWQREQCKSARMDGLTSGTPFADFKILNIACKEDPAALGARFGAVNLDIQEYDPQTGTDLRKIPNFVHGNALELPEKWTGLFHVVVLGEFIEHCVFDAARKALREAVRVARKDGKVVVTFPLDSRPPEAQHAPEEIRTLVEGETGHDITVCHQTVWTDMMLSRLFVEAGVREVLREPLVYEFLDTRRPTGWGVVLVNTEDPRP